MADFDSVVTASRKAGVYILHPRDVSGQVGGADAECCCGSAGVVHLAGEEHVVDCQALAYVSFLEASGVWIYLGC